ncbi:MAG: hypothetical protein Q9174_003822 [Haloplaca sp. 1 TL-2023]
MLRSPKPPEIPQNELHNPFTYTYGIPMFDYLDKDAEQKEAFDLWMSSRRAVKDKSWFDLYPIVPPLLQGVRQDADNIFLVDVGGGRGHDISALRERFPDLPGRLVLQDLPGTFKDLPKIEGVEFMAHDMFTAQPIKGQPPTVFCDESLVKWCISLTSRPGARAYFFRNVLHDWSNSRCRDILSQAAKAMESGYSRLLIEDQVLPDQGADATQAAIDINMYVMTGGIERTEIVWRELLDSAGLEIMKIWSDSKGSIPVIEAQIKVNE